MAKVVMGVAMIAGAVALATVTGGGGLWLGFALMQGTTMSAAAVSSAAMMLGTMGAGLTLSSISQALQGGGQALSQSIRSPLGSRVTIYGQTRVGGTNIYTSNPGYSVNQVIAWASHPCLSVDHIYADGREVYFHGNNHQAVAGSEGYCDEADHYDASGNKYNFFTGSNYHLWAYSTKGSYAGQYLSQLGLGAPPPRGDNNCRGDAAWDSSCTLNGICATYLGACSNANMFASIPNPKAAIHGKCDIYDPRLGAQFLSDGVTQNPATHIWTDNMALCWADHFTNNDFGVGAGWDEIDIDQLIVAANICDELVPLAGVGRSWQPLLSVVLGTQILDSNGNIETATYVPPSGSSGGVGVTGTTAPIWPTTVGGTVNDGGSAGVTWTMSRPASTPGYERRYTVNGSFDWSTAPGDIQNAILAAGEAKISYQGGLWRIYPAAWYGSTLSFGMGDLTGGIKWSPRRKFRDLFNAIRATFVCPSYPYAVVGYDRNHKDNNIFDGQFQPTDAPEYMQDAGHGYSSDANLAEDGGIRLYTDVRYQFVNSVATVQRLMKIRLLRNRQQGTGTLPMSLAAYRTCTVDVIQFTAPVLGWNNKYLEVENFRFVPTAGKGGGDSEKDDQAITLGCELDVCETDPSVYSWSVAEERTVENNASPALLDSMQVVDPTGLTLESDFSTGIVSDAGIVTPRILATWTEPGDPFTTSGGSITVQLQMVGDTSWHTAAILPGTATQCYIDSVVAGEQYNVQVCASHAGGASGNWVGAGPVMVSRLSSTASSNTAALGVTISSAGITVSWSAQMVGTIAVPAGSLTVAGGNPVTPYFIYLYIDPGDSSIHAVGPLCTAPSFSQMVQAASGGRTSLGCFAFTTTHPQRLAIGDYYATAS